MFVQYIIVLFRFLWFEWIKTLKRLSAILDKYFTFRNSPCSRAEIYPTQKKQQSTTKNRVHFFRLFHLLESTPTALCIFQLSCVFIWITKFGMNDTQFSTGSISEFPVRLCFAALSDSGINKKMGTTQITISLYKWVPMATVNASADPSWINGLSGIP